MTNNTTAPERIWAKERYDSWGNYGHWYSDAKGGGIEYVRADALEAAQARIAELEGALASCRQSAIWTPYHPACKTVIETVNAALQEGKE